MSGLLVYVWRAIYNHEIVIAVGRQDPAVTEAAS